MTEYEKLRDWVRSQGYTYEECDEGMIIIRPDFVAVVAYWEWSDLLTTIYMTHEVYEQMVSDMASVKGKNKLSPPVFAMTYGYGLVDVEGLEDETLNAFPFDGWLSHRISDDYFQSLIDEEYFAPQVQRIGCLHKTDPINYQVICGCEYNIYTRGYFDDYFKAKSALMRNAPYKNPTFYMLPRIVITKCQFNELWR